jgi:hypothetical protein
LEAISVCNGERHVLLAGAVRTPRPGVLAAVAGIDGDDQLASHAGTARDALDRAGPRRRPAQEVDHEPVAATAAGRQQEAARAYRAADIEHYPQFAITARRAANRGHHADGQTRDGEAAAEPHVPQIEHDARRMRKGEQRVTGRPAERKYHPRTIRGGPQPYGTHCRGGRARHGGFPGNPQDSHSQDHPQNRCDPTHPGPPPTPLL